MHLRTTTIRRNGNTYRYAQLVESYRRDDGMPATRILAHLGALPEQEVRNLKLALEASRSQRSVVVASADALGRSVPSVLANFAYLDLAVALEMWREWGLDELLASVLPKHEQQVRPELIVAALAVQRCVDPGSKLYAERWFPRTALPELLGIAPSQFNNTRIHRVLELLEQSTESLQTHLTRCYQARDGAFTSLFLDVTDTWFVGHGPALAQKGKTKEGMYQRKIGIVLMCNEAGLPVRWEVIAGRQTDGEAMLNLLEATRKVSWLDQAPIVMDRALGKTAYIRKLLASGLRFLTALTEDEFEAYTDRVPHHALAPVDAFSADAAQHAAKAALEAGMERLNDRLLVLDLGVIERRNDEPPPQQQVAATDSLPQALELVTRMSKDLRDGKAINSRQLGQAHGLKKQWVIKLLGLLQLAPDLQDIIRSGGASKIAVSCALRIAKLSDPQRQREAFNQETARAGGKTPRRRSAKKPAPAAPPANETVVRVRAVLCFNPEQFVEQRRGADDTLAQVNAFVTELNRALLSPRSRRTKQTAFAAVHGELRRRNLVEAFDIATLHNEDGSLRIQLTLRQQDWHKRRRFDGFSLLVAHPDILSPPGELDRLYRAKDAVEKDFHVIKSLIQLRPVRHRTEPKVRAHVTLCMLALLLERSLERKLAATKPTTMSASMAFELLRTVHLNQLSDAKTPVYTVTRPDADQSEILSVLGLAHLLDDEQLAGRISPR